ncbi:redoxin family protein [Streptomyces iconiensis]|uniref:Redoxin family protein n=1 Tax=Streptomyces iconiensis TaxID=1384038 RepID=A0ABT7AD42_9ACTN|nr:redoxin family protein [Streptomyces iconiensis]MDJ1138523.1 redoxin family protein [Streptomyces iconiensis]
MRIGEAARSAGATVKAVRYYESLGLLTPARLANGYRDYSERDARMVREIRELGALGIPAERARPFLDCLATGSTHGDDCPSSLAAYREAIGELDATIRALTVRRAELTRRLREAARRDPLTHPSDPPDPPDHPDGPDGPDGPNVPDERGKPNERDESNKRDKRDEPDLESIMTDTDHAFPLPPDLPVPEDDGGADHLPGLRMPDVTLSSTAGGTVALGALGPGRSVIYLYPLMGTPEEDLPDGWNSIPGARGCTPEACGFRDHHRELTEAGAARVAGLSSQTTEYQRRLVERLHLPFPMLSDPELLLRSALRLPMFEVEGTTLYRRLTLIVSDGAIEHVFYPVFPPDEHAARVLDWLREHPA